MALDPGLFVYSTWAQMGGTICSFFYSAERAASRAGTLENAINGATPAHVVKRRRGRKVSPCAAVTPTKPRVRTRAAPRARCDAARDEAPLARGCNRRAAQRPGCIDARRPQKLQEIRY